MRHVLPVKIECRHCFGDGFTTHGLAKPRKLTCSACNGAKHQWVLPDEVRSSDVRIGR